jgi:hypothetical protein
MSAVIRNTHQPPQKAELRARIRAQGLEQTKILVSIAPKQPPEKGLQGKEVV